MTDVTDIQVSDAFGNTVTVAALGTANCSDIANIIQGNLQPSFTVTANTSRGPGTAVCFAQVSKTVFLSVISPVNDSSNAVCSILPAIKQTGVQASQQASQARQSAAQNLPSDDQSLDTDVSTLNSDLKTATQDFAKMKQDYQTEQSDYQTELNASTAGCSGGGPLWTAWEEVGNESGQVPSDGTGFYVDGQLQNNISTVKTDITDFQGDITTSKP